MKTTFYGIIIGACLIVFGSLSASAQTPCGSVAECAQRAAEAATAANAAMQKMNARLDMIEKEIAAFGKGRLLGIAQVKNNGLVVSSPGVTYDTGKNEITFPNPENLIFVPIISQSLDQDYITSNYWVRRITAPNAFIIKQHAHDTDGATRTFPATDFTAVIIGFKK